MSNIDDLLRKRKQILEDIDNQIKADFTKPVTLLFTDIVGSTSYFERWGDIAGRQMIQTHNDLLFPLIESYAGNIIKTIGDAIMASYENPEKAVQSAVAMQEQLKGFNSTKPDHEKIRVRMGLHYGRAVIEEKDLFGDMVNTAARVESKAGGGEILISGSLHDQLPGVLDPSVIFLGSDFVKGKDKKIDFYLVNWDHKTSEEILRSWGNQVPQVPQVPQSSSNTPQN